MKKLSISLLFLALPVMAAPCDEKTCTVPRAHYEQLQKHLRELMHKAAEAKKSNKVECGKLVVTEPSKNASAKR